MPAFNYSALDKQDNLKKGILESDNAKQARQQLRNLGLKPLEVNQVNVKKSNGSIGIDLIPALTFKTPLEYRFKNKIRLDYDTPQKL